MLIMMMLGITSLGLIEMLMILYQRYSSPIVQGPIRQEPLVLNVVLRDSLRLFCMHAPLITHVGENPFPKVFEMVCSHLQCNDS